MSGCPTNALGPSSLNDGPVEFALRRTTPLFHQRRLASCQLAYYDRPQGQAALGCPGPSPVEHPFGRVATELLCRVLDDSQAVCVTTRRIDKSGAACARKDAIPMPHSSSTRWRSPAAALQCPLRLLTLVAFLAGGLPEAGRTADMTVEQVKALLSTPGQGVPDLSNRDLGGLDLSNIDFKRANLTGAAMRKTNLAGADLSGAVLDLAILRGANLKGAKLRDVSAFSTIFASADLSGADLSGAKLVCNFENANLRGANLQGVAAGADMRNQSMGLMRISLRNAKLGGANLAGADISRGMIEFADLSGADLTGANLMRAAAGGADFSSANLAGANFTEADVQDARFMGAVGLDKAIGFDTVLHKDSARFE